MMQAFEGVYLIKLDVDQWNGGGSKFNVKVIPIFFRLGADASPTGEKIDGGAWGPDTYKNIAETMGPWFHRP